MAMRWICPWFRVLPAVVGLGMVASCRNGEERARAVVLQAGYRFTIEDYLRAAGEGRGAVVEHFLEAGMQVDAVGSRGETALRRAAAGGQTHLVQRLLAAGAAPDQADAQGITPLMAAAGVGDGVSVAALRKAGAAVERQDAAGRSALVAAAAAGHAGVVEVLVTGTEGDLEPVMQVACASGHTGVIDALLKADRGGIGLKLEWPGLLKAAASGGHLPAVRLLSSRMPESPEAAEVRNTVASGARTMGYAAVADFLEAEAKRFPAEPGDAAMAQGNSRLNQPVGGPPQGLAGEPSGDGVGNPAAGAGPIDSAGGAVAGLPLAASVPVTLRGSVPVPAGLGGQRFPRVNCGAMSDVPQILTMVAWEPRAWPVVLQDVAVGHESAQIVLMQDPPRTVTLRVGDEIPGTGCVVEKLRRRRLYTDASETTLKNRSELRFRRVSTGETFLAVPEEAVLSNDSTALLRIAGSEREWSTVPGDEFRLGSLLLRVKEIAEASLVLENRLTRETATVPLTARP